MVCIYLCAAKTVCIWFSAIFWPNKTTLKSIDKSVFCSCSVYQIIKFGSCLLFIIFLFFNKASNDDKNRSNQLGSKRVDKNNYGELLYTRAMPCTIHTHNIHLCTISTPQGVYQPATISYTLHIASVLLLFIYTTHKTHKDEVPCLKKQRQNIDVLKVERGETWFSIKAYLPLDL